jgi:serine O-acetyltransferase
MLSEPGFWVVALHRLGNARMDVRARLLRAPLTLAYLATERALNWMWGIQLPYTVRLGRRVRIWHHGGTVLGARAIGDDVHIRHNTTFGVLTRGDNAAKPIIGNRVDVGVGAVILGPVTVGDDAVVGPNSVVLRHVPPGTVVMGVPARQAALKADGPPQAGAQPQG